MKDFLKGENKETDKEKHIESTKQKAIDSSLHEKDDAQDNKEIVPDSVSGKLFVSRLR